MKDHYRPMDGKWIIKNTANNYAHRLDNLDNNGPTS